MNENIKNAFYATLSVVIILPAIFLVSDYIYFQEPLSRVALYPDDPVCDKECTEQRSDGYRCTEIKQDEYVCRKQRGFSNNGDNAVLHQSAGPISYGEIISFPEDNFDTVLFNIAGVKITDKDSKTIQVDFAESQDLPDVTYSAKLKPNDSFLSCINPWESTHLVYYTGLFEYENRTYAEFWGLHPYTPPELFPCDLPKLWEQSLRHDYDILIPEYEEFGFEVGDKPALESEYGQIDSRKINPEKDIPTFLGYDVPEICTEDMIKHLVKYSTMFERGIPYGLDWVGLGESIDPDDFDKCVDELLKRNPKTLENKNDVFDQLKGILGNCACQERVLSNPDTVERCLQPYISWGNFTHYINNNICEWQKDSVMIDILDRCTQIKETGTFGGFAYGASWQNDTHYIDNTTCEWKNIK